MPNFWMVRAGTGGALAREFLKERCVAIGFGAKIDLNTLKDKDQIKNFLAQQCPEVSAGKRSSWVGSIHRFKSEVQVGDQVTFYDSATREYHVGEVTGPCVFRPGFIQDMHQTRAVIWKHTISRDELSAASRNALGSLLTIFEPGDEVRDEFAHLIEGKQSPKPVKVEALPDADPIDTLREEFVEKAHEFIKDRILKLDWEEMQELVAAILRALGYRTRVSPKGSDQGKDIIASPDGLGLSSPRIKAEVKHRPRSQMGAPEVRSFLGGLRGEDRGLYVSTGGFSMEATYEAERAAIPVTLITLDDLASLLVQHYDKMDSDGQALVPLLRMYWPAS
jgi:restriction system protein